MRKRKGTGSYGAVIKELKFKTERNGKGSSWEKATLSIQWRDCWEKTTPMLKAQ